MPLLLLLFVVVPFVEFALLMQVGARIGPLATIALVIATGVLGASLARSQGLSVLQRLQADMAEGREPTMALLEGVAILMAGVVLITPGFLTDALGLLVLIPATRRVLLQGMARSLKAQAASGRVHVQFGRFGPGGRGGPGGPGGPAPGPRTSGAPEDGSTRRRPTGLAPDGSPVIDVPVEEVRPREESGES